MPEQTVFAPAFGTPPKGPLGGKPEAPAVEQTVFAPSFTNTSEAGRLWYQQQYDDLLTLDSSQELEPNRLLAIYLGKALQVPTRAAYLNLDNYAQQYFKKKDLPLSYLQAAQNQWRRSWIDIETSKLGLMMDPDNEEKWQRYDELMASRPREDNVQRNFLGQAGLSAIQFIPSMVDTGVAHALFGAGGALVGAGIGSLTAGPAGAAAGAKLGWNIGGKVGGTIENINLEANSIFLQVMTTVDPATGKPVYKNPELRGKFATVARTVAIPFGAIAGALEELSFEKVTGGGTFLKPLFEKSGLSVVKKWVESGKLQNYFTTLLAKYPVNIATEVLQESAQTLTEQLGADIAIEAGNAVSGTGIPTATVRDYARQLLDTAKQTAMGMSLIGIGGTVRETSEAMRGQAAEKTTARREQLVKDADAALKDAKTARASANGAQPAAAPSVPTTVRLTPEAPVAGAEAGGGATGAPAAPENAPAPVAGPRGLRIEDPQTGTLYGRVNVDVGSASVGIQNLTTAAGFESQAKDAIVAVMAENPGKAIAWTPADTIGNRIRDQLLEENPRRQALQQDLRELQDVEEQQKKSIEAAMEPGARAAIEADLRNVKAEIRRYQKRLDAIGLQWYDESARPVEAGTSFGDLEDSARRAAEPWRETRAEFVERTLPGETENQEALPQPPQATERPPQNAELRRLIAAAAPGWTPEEVDHAAVLTDIAAEAKGMTTQDWMDAYLAPGVFADQERAAAPLNQGQKAGVEFLQDGRALISLSRTADFSSWVHEMAHVFRRQLPDADLAIAAAWAGAEGATWSEAAEETFAQGFEDYLREGTAPSPELRGIFQRFADWMRRIYRSIRSIVSTDIRGVYDRILTRGQPAASAPAAGPEVLHQPGDIEARRQRVEEAFERLEAAVALEVHGTREALKRSSLEIAPRSNANDSKSMNFSKVGLGEAIHKSADIRKALLIPHVGELFETSVSIEIEPHDSSKKKSTNIRAWHHYITRAKVNGQEVLARITAFEIKEKGKDVLVFHDLNVSSWENRRGLSPRRVLLPKQGVQATSLSVDLKIQQLLSGVNTTGFNMAFRRWFQASKVVDESGRPLRLYHGTAAPENFGAFEITRDIGFHFGPAPQANAKAGGIRELHEGEAGSRLIPVYLSIQNPLQLSQDITQRGEKMPHTEAAEILIQEAGLDGKASARLRAMAERSVATEQTAETVEQAEAARKGFWNAAREALQEVGYDGMRYPNEVEGTGESWIAFEDWQAKSVSNRGTWSPKTGVLLFQPSPEAAAGKEHEESTREAVEAGEAVPDQVLEEYKDRDWAKTEIDRRARLAVDAATFDSAEEFGSYAEAMAAPGEPPHASDYYTMIWEQTRESATTDRKTANEQFLSSMTREGLSKVLQEAAQRGMVDNMTGIVKSGALSVRNGGLLTEPHYLKIMALLRDDPAGYRAIFAGVTGDEDAIRQLESERREKETTEEKLRGENRRLRREVQKKEASARTAERTANRERSYSADIEAKLAQIKKEKDAKIAAMKTEAIQKLTAQKETLTTKGRDRIKEYRERQREKDAKASKTRKSRGSFNKKIRDLKRIQGELKYMHPDARKPIEGLLKGILLKGMTSSRKLALTDLRQRLQADPDTEMSEYDMEKLAELDKTSVRDMSMEDFDSLYNAIKHFAWRNRQIQSTIRGDQQLHKEQAKETAIGDLRKVKPLPRDQFSEEDPGPDTTPIDTTKDLLKSKFDIVDNLLGIGQNHYNLIVEKIAGIKSVIHKLFVENIEEARKTYIAYKQKVFDTFHADIKDLGIRDLAGWLNEVREVGRYKLRRGELLALWMHAQNEDNRESLVLRGFGLAERKNDVRYEAFNTEAELMKLVNTIDPDELVFVRAAQKLFAQQGQDLGAVFLEKNGYELALVENYYPKDVMPIEYGKDQEKKDALDELQGRWTRVGISKGMLKSRKGADVALNLHNIATDLSRSVERSASYIAFEIPLSQASGLLYDKQFRAELSTRYSPRVWKAIEQGLRDIAGEYKPVDPGDKFGLALRSGMTQAFLGFNAWSPLKQITSLVNASPYVRPDYLVRGFAETVVHPKESIEFNKKNSLLFYERLESGFARDIAEASRNRGEGLISSRANLIRRVSFLGIKSMDSLAVSSVMRGAWLQAMDELASGKLSPEVSKALDLTPEAAAKLSVDERNAQAFRFADYVSTRTQDQALPEYRSPLSRSRSSFMRFMTMFGSSSNTALGIIRQAFAEVQADPKSAMAKKKLAVAAFAILVMAPAAEASINALRNAVRGGLAGQPPEDEEAKKRWIQDYIASFGGLTYFVRDAVDMAQSTAAQLSGGGRYGGSSTIDPISTLYDTIQTTVSYGYRAATEEDLMQRRRYIGRFADSAALLVSLLSKLPLYMPTKGVTRLLAPPEKKE